MRSFGRAIAAMVLVSVLAAPSASEARFFKKLQAGIAQKMAGFRTHGFKGLFKVSTPAKRTTRRSPQIVPGSVTRATAGAYISKEIRRQASFGDLDGKIKVLRSTLKLNPNRTRFDGANKASGFTVKIKVEGERGTRDVKGFFRTDKAGSLRVADRVQLETRMSTSTILHLSKK